VTRDSAKWSKAWTARAERRLVLVVLATCAVGCRGSGGCCPDIPNPCGDGGSVDLSSSGPPCEQLTSRAMALCGSVDGGSYQWKAIGDGGFFHWNAARDCSSVLGCSTDSVLFVCANDLRPCLDAVTDAGGCLELESLRCNLPCHSAPGSC
jgi:hypothetical protein